MYVADFGIQDKKFQREIGLFLSYTNSQYWKKLIEKIESEPSIFYKNYYLFARNPFILPIIQYFNLLKKGQSIWKKRTPEIDFLARTAYTVNIITKNLNEQAKKKIISRITDKDPRSILFEFRIASHFLTNGYDVEFVEYERTYDSGKTFDFHISKSSIAAEIECKWKNYNTGRKIKRDTFYQLCDEIFKKVNSNLHNCIVDIQCKTVLPTDWNIIQEIANNIKIALDEKRKETIIDDTFFIKFIYLSENKSIKSSKDLHEILQPYYTINSHFATIPSQEGNLIIKIESLEDDDILNPIFYGLKKSRKQFSGQKPSLIACHLESILPEEWEKLIGKNRLAKLTSDFFRKEGSTHIHTISFSSEGRTFQKPNLLEYGKPGLVYMNPHCIYNTNENLFGLKTKKYKNA